MTKIRSTIMIVAALAGGAPTYLAKTQPTTESVTSSQEKTNIDAQLSPAERRQQDL